MPYHASSNTALPQCAGNAHAGHHSKTRPSERSLIMSDKRTRSPVLRAHITSGAARGNQSYAASNAARSRVRSHALTLASRIGAGRVVRRSPSVLQQAHGRKRGVGRDAKRLRGGIARDVGHSKVWRHLAAQGVRVVSLAENPLALGIAVAHGCLP